MLKLPMPNKKYDLVGGASHGESVEVSDSVDSVESPGSTHDVPTFETRGEEIYVRRHFKGEEFGEGSDVFGVSTDDDTETRELARMMIHESDPPNKSDVRSRTMPE